MQCQDRALSQQYGPNGLTQLTAHFAFQNSVYTRADKKAQELAYVGKCIMGIARAYYFCKHHGQERIKIKVLIN